MPIDHPKFQFWSKVVSLIVAIVVGVYGAVTFIDNRIDKKLAEASTLRKVAELVRPSCIFDERGSILFDSGAMQTIEEIKVEDIGKEQTGGKLPFRVIVRPKRLLTHAPLISVLDTFSVDIAVERGPKFDWVYTIYYGGPVSEKNQYQRCRYRLEVL